MRAMAGHLEDTRGGEGAAVEIRPGSVIGRAFDVYRGQAATLLGAAVIVFAIQLVLALLLPNGLLFIAGLASFVLSIFYQGMVVNLVKDVQDGRRDHSMGELFSAVGPVALPLIGLAIVAGIAIAIGFVLIIIPGLILLTIWAVAAPVMVIEHPGVFAALGRSRELVRGHGWQVFGTLVLVFLLLIVVGVLISAVLAPLPDAVAGFVSGLVSGTLVSPYLAVVVTLGYFRLLAAHDQAASPYGAQPPYGG